MHPPYVGRCPYCGHGALPDRRFCTECGRSLGSACPACAAPIEGGEKFCGTCGAPLAGMRGATAPPSPEGLRERARPGARLEGERKHVTVLFADLADSMDLAERFDAEEWRRIMDRFFRLLADGVERFGGSVNQFTGDGILALFGAPVAQEDHAQRACRAALLLRDRARSYGEELRQRYDIDFQVRIGLNSGEVVLTEIGEGRHKEYSAQGYTVGIAERMEHLARPGRIYMARATAALVLGYVEFRDLGPFAVKGVSEPVHVFELLRAGTPRARLDVARERGLSRFVGRRAELARLQDALRAAIGGDGSVVGVVGDPGVGKSRLCLEFVDHCRGDGILVHSVHCSSHGQSIPFLPMLELLRAYFGITEMDSARQTRKKIIAAASDLDEKHRSWLPVLFEFLDVPDPEWPAPSMDPDARQRQLAALLGEVIRLRSAEEPEVLLIDDLHWIDRASDDLLAAIVPALAGTRTLLLLNHRPEYVARWKSAKHHHELALAPLAPGAIDEMMKELLGFEPALARLAERLRDRAGGNPFFVEEAVRSLAEGGALQGARGRFQLTQPIEEVQIPASLRSAIAARIDRLGEEAKRTVQTAAVIGKSFQEGVLRAVSGLEADAFRAAMGSLLAAGILRRSPDQPDAECAFHHPLTQEIAYRSQLADQRAQLHGSVARALTDHFGERINENAALLAYHWEQAGDHVAAASWHARAAEWRSADHAPASMQHWWKVRELLRQAPETEETTALGVTACVRIMNLGWRLGLTEAEAETLFEEGKELASRRGDVRSLAMIANLYVANVQAGLGRSPSPALHRTLERARSASRLAVKSDDAGVKLSVCVNRLYALYLAGKLRDGLAFLEQTLEQAPADPRLGMEWWRFSPLMWIRSFRGQLLSYMGRPEEAGPGLQEAVRWASEHGEVENQGWAEDFSVTQAWALGNAEAALAHASGAVEIADTTGSAFSRVLAYKALGMAHLVDASWSEAVNALEAALAIGREARANVFEEPSVLALLAQGHLGAGEAASAVGLAQEAVTLARERRARLFECEAQLALAGALLETQGGSARSALEAALERAAALVEETGACTFAPFLHERRAALALQIGDQAAHARELGDARKLFDAMGAAGHASRTNRGSAARVADAGAS